MKLENYQHPVYLGVTLDHTLNYIAHIKSRGLHPEQPPMTDKLSRKVGVSPKYVLHIDTRLVLFGC